MHKNRGVKTRQLDDGIGDTLVSALEVLGSGHWRYHITHGRRCYRFDRQGLRSIEAGHPIRSDLSSQSSAKTLGYQALLSVMRRPLTRFFAYSEPEQSSQERIN